MLTPAPTFRTIDAARRLIGMGLSGAAALVVAIFVVGRLDLGFASTLANPWAVQCCVTLAGLAVTAALVRRPRLSVVTTACAAWAFGVVLPTLTPHDAPPAPPGAAPIRVVEANVCNRTKPTDAAIASLRGERPDLLAILELTDGWEGALERVRGELPYAVIGSQSQLGSGLALYSRYPLRNSRVTVACEGADRQIEVTVDHPSGPIRVFVIHPLSPRSVERATLRDRELAILAERCAASDAPTLVIGDFNETPFGKTYASFIGRTGYEAARGVAGLAPTWPAEVDGWMMPAAVRIPIDHVVMSRHFVANAFRVANHIGSDHMPIVADLAFAPPDANRVAPALIASPLPSARPEDQ